MNRTLCVEVGAVDMCRETTGRRLGGGGRGVKQVLIMTSVSIHVHHVNVHQLLCHQHENYKIADSLSGKYYVQNIDFFSSRFSH